MATQINNKANATFKYGIEGTGSAVSNVASTILQDAYALTGSKASNNSEFMLGENITYQININNTGTQPLYSITIEDDLGGAGMMTFMEGSASAFVDGVVYNFAPISTDPLTLVLPVTLNGNDNALITYVATVSSTLDSSISAITNTITMYGYEEAALTTRVDATGELSCTIDKAEYAEINIIKEVSTPNIVVNEPFSYTLTLTNSGNQEATGVVLTDVLPEGFVINTIRSVTNEEVTVYTASNYSVEPATNTLTLPSTEEISISVPASTSAGPGMTVVTITGYIAS